MILPIVSTWVALVIYPHVIVERLSSMWCLEESRNCVVRIGLFNPSDSGPRTCNRRRP